MAPSALLPETEPEYVVVHAGKGTIRRQILTGDQKKPTFDTIPQIDFSNMNSSCKEKRRALAKEVGNAFKDSGFMYAANHGISEVLQDDLYRVIQQFFALPLEEKMKIHINKSDAMKGYEALLETKLDANTRGDLKEAFSQGDDPYEAEQTAPPGLLELLATLGLSYPQNGNQWPSEASIPGFRKIIHEYSDAVLDFSKKLMRLIALSLDLEENYFDHMADFPMSSIRALHYPSQEVAGDIGIGAHADYSWFTLVNQLSPTPALEVLNHNGQWISAPPIRNTLVCNVGDFLEMATNNTFVSTVHRVVNKTGEERYSIPYFFSPSKDVMIETVPTCLKEGEDGMVPIRAGKWNWERLMRARYKHPAVIAARANGEL